MKSKMRMKLEGKREYTGGEGEGAEGSAEAPHRGLQRERRKSLR